MKSLTDRTLTLRIIIESSDNLSIDEDDLTAVKIRIYLT